MSKLFPEVCLGRYQYEFVQLRDYAKKEEKEDNNCLGLEQIYIRTVLAGACTGCPKSNVVILFVYSTKVGEDTATIS